MSPTVDQSANSFPVPTSLMHQSHSQQQQQQPQQQVSLLHEQPLQWVNGLTGDETNSFELMLDKIKLAFSRPDNRVDVEELRQILQDYKSDERHWTGYAHFDPFKYKRNFVVGGDNYTVMILTWPPNTQSCIHDHSGSHCFMKMLDGELIESRFEWPKGDVTHAMRKVLDQKVTRDEIIYINDKVALHRVSNGSRARPAASLHIYIPPIHQCQAFDQTTGRSKICNLSFFSKRGEIIG